MSSCNFSDIHAANVSCEGRTSTGFCLLRKHRRKADQQSKKENKKTRHRTVTLTKESTESET